MVTSPQDPPFSPSADLELFSSSVLVEELRQLKRRSFGELSERDLARRAPALEGMARALYPTAESAAPPLRKLLRAAVAEIQDQELGASAAALFGLEPSSYGKSLAARQDAAAACFTPKPAPSTFRQRPQYTPRIVDELAAALARLSAPVTAQETQDRHAAQTIARTGRLEEARTLLQGTGKVLWIWGGPGTGKTVLAQQAAQRVRTHLPQVTVRLENSRVAESDVLSAVGLDDVDARSWSPAACLLHFRKMLSEGRSVGVAVIDGVTDEEALWELVPDTLRVPLIVTSRKRSDHAAAAGLHVGAYSSEEALAVVGGLLPALPPQDARRLTAAVDHHPLVIDRVCRHVLGESGHSVEDLSAALVADLLSTLDSVDSISGAGEHLSRVYRRTLATLRDEAAINVEVLAALLFISSKGTVPKTLAGDFLRHRFAGTIGALRVSAALRVLDRWAIVSEENDAFVMHPLTAVILQGMLAESSGEVVTDFFSFLREASPGGSPLTGRMHSELVVMDRVMRTFWPGEQSLLCLSSDVWLWLDRTGRSGPVRYEVRPEAVYTTDGRTRHAMRGEALETLVEQTKDYYEAMVVLRRLAVPAPVDDQVSEYDGLVHYVSRSAQLEDGLTRAVCGKKWVRSAAGFDGLPVCPRCAARMEPRVDRMTGRPAPSLPFLLRKLLRAADPRSAGHDAGRAVAYLELLRDPSPSIALPQIPGTAELFDMATAALKVHNLATGASDEQKHGWLDDSETWVRRYLELEVENARLHAAGHELLGHTLLYRTYLMDDRPVEERCSHYLAAARAYRESLALRPDGSGALEGLQEALTRHAFVLVPTAPMEAEQLVREIESAYRPYLEAAPDDATALGIVGISLANRGKWMRASDPVMSEELYSRAVDHFRRSLALSPGTPITLLRLGDSLVRYAGFAADDPETAAGRYGEAAQVFAEGARLEPGNENFRRGVAFCEERLRD
ncbi:DUF3039 domain-containing protein [Streptomyces sp. NPDC006516]|uniref:DUF3039 domain-containing protein n=1 Tax=Streptomyces sp. NPDC006516 TaxID=3154309 RepID=UPI0033A133C1